jgi:hypothetical protein
MIIRRLEVSRAGGHPGREKWESLNSRERGSAGVDEVAAALEGV